MERFFFEEPWIGAAFEKPGHKAETQALFRLLQPFGVQQFVRSGTVAIIKSRRELLNEYLEELERNRQRTDSF